MSKRGLKEIQSEMKIIQDQISAIRQARKAHVDGIIQERGAKMNNVAQIAGMKPAKPSLTPSDLQVIEETFNRQIAPLRESLRLIRADEAAARIPGLDDRLDAFKAERDKAAAALAEHEAAVKAVEIEIRTTLKIAEGAKDPLNRIRFKSKLRALEHESSLIHRQKLIDEILNY